ncbi:MAG: ExbD/TolR family protein [Thiolinea sp.]
MSTRTARRHRKSMAEMNVVPYIDVMLVLLVIFMVTAPMMQAGVEVDMPDATAKPLTANNQQEPLIISVDQNGQYFSPDGAEMGIAGIAAYIDGQMAEPSGQRPIYIRADSGVEYRYLMDVMVAAQKAGAKKIGLMADPLAATEQ